MEYLLSPDTGLIVWTLVTFLCLVVLLGKFAWKPILASIEEREERIKKEIQAAEEARRAADNLKSQYETHLAAIERKTEEMIAEAKKKGDEVQAGLVRQAQASAKEILEKAKDQLDADRERLLADLRGEIGALTAMATERLLKKKTDISEHNRLVEELLEEIGQAPKN
ncbi:MAG: F0F1 ATP synthase subunit B [Elusimicrobia bacterium]|nr:F0F1 ATP synthase subunit B [Elusimicrobiota bacterium]